MSTAKNGNYLDIFPILLFLLVIHEDSGGRHHAVAHDLDDIAHLLKFDIDADPLVRRGSGVGHDLAVAATGVNIRA